MEKIYTVPEAAKISRMSIPWWRQKVLQKKVRFLKVGSRVLIPESTIDEIFNRSAVEPRDSTE